MIKQSELNLLVENKSRATVFLTRVSNWEWAIALLLVPLLLLPGWWSWGALFILVALWLLRWLVTRTFILPATFILSVFLLSSAILVGLLVSLNLTLSINRAWCFLAGLAVFFSVVQSFDPKIAIKWAGFGLAGLGMLLGISSLVATNWGQGELVKLPAIYDHLPHLLEASFGSGASGEEEINPRVVGGTMAMLVPVAWLAFGSSSGSKPVKVTLLLFSLFLSFILFLTQSPTAIGGVLLAFLILGLLKLFSPGKWKFIFLILLLGGLFALTYLIVTFLPGVLPPPTQEPTRRIVFRMEMWLRAIDMFLDKPFTGIGLNNFPHSINLFYPTYSLGAEAHAHNLLLQTAMDGGILGLLGLIGILVAITLTIVKAWRINPQARPLLVGIATGTLAWLFYGVAESITLAHKPAVILWFMWGLAVVLAKGYPPHQALAPLSKRFLPKQGLTTLGLITTLLLAGLSIIFVTQDRLWLNLAIIKGQEAIIAGNSANSSAVSTVLQDAMQKAPVVSSATYDLAARLATKQGNYQQAELYLRNEIEQDQKDTISKYIPGEWDIWKNISIKGSSPLLRLYSQWKARYPADPIAYARLALAQNATCNRSAALQTFSEGISRTSFPFLFYLKEHLQFESNCYKN